MLRLRSITTLVLFSLALSASSYTCAAERPSYKIQCTAAHSGGPVRGAALSSVTVPEAVQVSSDGALNETKQALIAWHFRNAARLAEDFARAEGVAIARQALPSRVELFKNPSALARATGLPEQDRLGQAVARVDLRRGMVLLGRDTPEDLYVELGKWLFYEKGYRWGLDVNSDRRHLELAERFAGFCLDKKRWTEVGGSAGSIR